MRLWNFSHPKLFILVVDEVKYTHWKNSETVQAYMKENKLASPAELSGFLHK